MNQDESLSAILGVKLDCPEAKARCFDYQTGEVELGKA